MADPRPDRRAYLARVAESLRLPEDVAHDVVDELDGHLTDSTRSLVAEGLSAAQAERESIARLGDPAELAGGIRAAHQTRRRLLVAAGYGVWAAAAGAFWGLLFAIGVVSLALVLAFLVIWAVVESAGLEMSGFGATWTTISLVAYSAMAGHVAGIRVPPVIAARGRYGVEDVTRPVALVGGLLVAFVTLFVVRTDLDPGTVVALLTLPIAFAFGASRAHRSARTGRVRLANRTVVGIALGAAVLLTVDGLTSLRPSGTTWMTSDGTGQVGPPASDVMGDAWAGLSSSWRRGEPLALTVTAEPPTALDGWRDLRIEIWPASRSAGLDPTATTPVLMRALEANPDGGFGAAVELPPSRTTRYYVAVATGLAPNDRRYVLAGPDGPHTSSPWHGTVWEYLIAP